MDFYKRTVKFLARSSYLVHMARGRRGRPASVRSRASRVSPDIDFGLHSLRSGGASQAARSGVSGRVWRRHGGWRSIQAADGYVDESLENTLVVSRNLAL